jgi:hypothetical protein
MRNKEVKCMISKYKMISLIFIVITLVSVVAVSADAVFYPELRFKNDGIIWYFSTLDLVTGDKWFSGHDVYDIQAVYKYTYSDLSTSTVDIEPKAIALADKHVKLSFDKSTLPASYDLVPDAIYGEILVYFKVVDNIETHIAAGPGFGWRRRP